MTLRTIVAATAIAMLLVGASAAAQLDGPKPTIHRVTIDDQSGVLTITGAGLGEHLAVAIEGMPVALLPGATDTRIEVAVPAALMITPGTYRLSVMDPSRQ